MRRRRLTTAALGLALLGGSVVATAAPGFADDLEISVGDFEAEEGWSLNLGPEFPGAQGSFTLDDADATQGSQSGLVVADFTGGGNYVQISRSIGEDVTGVQFDVRSSDVNAINLRMVDATGQTHQQRVPLAAGGQWQTLSVTDFDSGTAYTYFGGANDGVWHGPAQQLRFVIDAAYITGGERTAQVRFDAVSVTAPAPALRLTSTQAGNVFVGDQAPEFGVVTAGDTVTWRVTDSDGQHMTEGAAAVSSTGTIRPEVTQPGHYRLQVTATDGGAVVGTSETDFAILTAFDAPASSPFGVAAHFLYPEWLPVQDELIDLAADAGITSVREDATWSDIERTAGEYTFETFDPRQAKLDQAGIRWLPIADYTNPHYDGNATPYTDEGRAAFAAYAAATMEHYQQAPWIEVYNEFNIAFGDRGDGPADSRPDYYFPLLRETYLAVKEVRPDAVVLGAATAGVPLPWLEELFALGGLEYMDAVSVHPYVYPQPPERFAAQLEALDALIREYNGGEPKPIWITEQGWPTQLDARGVDEATQAAYLVQAHAIAFAQGVEQYYWYDLMNDGIDPAYNEDNFGIIRNPNDAMGLSPKPAYVSYAVMTRQLGEAIYTSSDALDGVTSHVFETGSGATRVMWAAEPTTIALRTDEPVRVTDLYGEERIIEPLAGRAYLTVGADPVYVAGDVVPELTARIGLSGPETAVATGEDIELELTIDTSAPPRRPVVGTFEIGDQSIPVNVRPGRTATIPVTVPAGTLTGAREATGDLVVNGETVAHLHVRFDVVPAVSLEAGHVLDGDDNLLRLTLENVSSRVIPGATVAWQIGDATGTTDPATLAAGDRVTVDLPLPATPGEYDYALTLTAEGEESQELTGTANVVARDAMNPVTERTIVVDGVADDLTGVPGVDLTAEGTIQIGDHTGPDDLGGNLWATWDEQALYLTATVTDDVHAQPNTGERIWDGDSIQVAVSAGTPGETTRWYEYGFALTANGPEAYLWLAAEGQTGPVTGVDLAVTRDDAAHLTTYEVAIPWDRLAPIEPGDGLLSLSLALNEHDGAGRAGWIEWGSGIAGSKDPSLFQPMVLV